MIISEYDHTNCQGCYCDFCSLRNTPQEFRLTLLTATLTHSTRYYKLPSVFKAAACRVFEIDSLERFPSFRPSFRHFVVLAPGTGEPISCPITGTISSASNLRSAVGPLTTPQLNHIAGTQLLRVNCHIKF